MRWDCSGRAAASLRQLVVSCHPVLQRIALLFCDGKSLADNASAIG